MVEVVVVKSRNSAFRVKTCPPSFDLFDGLQKRPELVIGGDTFFRTNLVCDGY